MSSIKAQLPTSMIPDTDIETYWDNIVGSYLKGSNVLPHQLGLSESKYNTLIEYLQSIDLVSDKRDLDSQDCSLNDKRTIFHELLLYRREERDAVANLLLKASDVNMPQREAMAIIIATASLGSHHLWQDLGLSDRQQLNALMKAYFPSLHASNTRGMRWKRFIYKQLCEQGGDYVCRSPSCDECSSFSECFSPE